MYTTQNQVRKAFWDHCAEFQPQFKRVPGKTQNDYSADIRARWCDFVEEARLMGDISEAIAQRVTL